MIETNTKWEDSGFDCDHCGGEILKRTDRESGRPDFVCFQCRECGCQWNLDGRVHRVGSEPQCKKAARERSGGVGLPDFISEWWDVLSRRLWILAAIVAGVFLLRFGGGVVIRYLLPLVLIGAAVYVLARYGRTQEWW